MQKKFSISAVAAGLVVESTIEEAATTLVRARCRGHGGVSALRGEFWTNPPPV